MTNSSVKTKVDFLVVGLVLILAFSAAMVVNLVSAGQASAFTLHQTTPKRYNSALASPDGCYSVLNDFGTASQLLNVQQMGLVNAVVNVPVYDWDQGTGPESWRFQQTMSPKGTVRPPVLANGQAIGYMKNFDFKVTPVPNPYWVGLWLSNPTPPVVPKSGDYVANPFLYQQFAAIDASGMPIPALFNGTTPPPTTGGGTQGNYQDAQTGIGQMGDLINNNQNQTTNAANSSSNKNFLRNNYNSGNLSSSEFISQLVTGVFGFASSPFSVRGDPVPGVPSSGPADNCYENKNATSGYSAPSYAFSVVNMDLPVTIPGWFYMPVTLVDALFAGDPLAGISWSGVTFYIGGTLNNKFILDCYGRDKQPIVVPEGRDLASYVTSGLIADILAGKLGSAGINIAMAIAVGWPPAASVLASCGILAPLCIPAAIGAAQAPLRGMPALRTAHEDYSYGFAFAFSVEPNNNFDLPDHLNNRVVDKNKSNFFDINKRVLTANPAICPGSVHNCSENGAQFNPDVWVKLKEPYVLDSAISFDSDQNHRMPDGQSITVTVDALKNGFSKDPYNPYPKTDTQADRAGGPTYNDNDGPNGRSFTSAQVYRIEMKPGVVPNAIDLDKLKDGSIVENQAYRGDSATADVCGFLKNQLGVGDGLAQPSQVPDNDTPPNTSTNANNHRDAFTGDPDSYQCSKVHDEPIRMNTGVHKDDLYTYTENIPAETPPGTKICYAVYYDHYTNDSKYRNAPWWKAENASRIGDFNPSYWTPDDSSYLSRARCIVAGYKPSFQVRGGDLIAGENVYTNVNRKDDVTHQNPDGSYQKRIYGSWAEYGAVAGGVISQLGSGGTYRLGMPSSLTEEGPLTFSNDRKVGDPSVHTYGHYATSIDDGFDKIADRFSQESPTQPLISGNVTVNLHDLEGGVYRIQNNANVTLVSQDASGNAAAIGNNKSIILLVGKDAKINIKSNITIPQSYATAGEISQVVLAPQTVDTPYTINIANTVEQVDAWLVNNNGAINTCWIEGASVGDYRLIPRAFNGECNNTVYINGPVSAKTLYLRRNGGKDQSDDPTKLEQSVPGEVFNLRPDAYIWAANHVDSSNKKYITTNVLDLPPRY